MWWSPCSCLRIKQSIDEALQVQEMQQQLCSLGFAKSSKQHAPSFPFLGTFTAAECPCLPVALLCKGSNVLTYGSTGIWLHASFAADKAIQDCSWIMYRSYYCPLLSFISLGIFFPTTLFLRREKNALYPVFKAIPSSNTNTSIFTDCLLPSTNSNNMP